jgi:hypothetical protein
MSAPHASVSSMGETVTILAIASGAAVSLGTVGATAYREGVQRRWQSREERTIDLRTVLERAAENFGKAMFVVAEGLAELESTGQVSGIRRADLVDAQQRVVLAGNQIGVRRGPRSDEHVAFLRCLGPFLIIKGILDQAGDQERDEAWRVTFSNARGEAATAEREYLEATAKALSHTPPTAGASRSG